MGYRQRCTDDELDTALVAGRIELTRPNERVVRCARIGCNRLIGVGQGRRLFVDGHARGFLCLADCWGLGDLRGIPSE